MTTGMLDAGAVTALVALVAVLAVRTVLAERAAGVGDGTPRAWSRPMLVRRLDVAAVVLAVLCAATLVAIVVAGAPA